MHNKSYPASEGGGGIGRTAPLLPPRRKVVPLEGSAPLARSILNPLSFYEEESPGAVNGPGASSSSGGAGTAVEDPMHDREEPFREKFRSDRIPRIRVASEDEDVMNFGSPLVDHKEESSFLSEMSAVSRGSGGAAARNSARRSSSPRVRLRDVINPGLLTPSEEGEGHLHDQQPPTTSWGETQLHSKKNFGRIPPSDKELHRRRTDLMNGDEFEAIMARHSTGKEGPGGLSTGLAPAFSAAHEPVDLRRGLLAAEHSMGNDADLLPSAMVDSMEMRLSGGKSSGPGRPLLIGNSPPGAAERAVVVQEPPNPIQPLDVFGIPEIGSSEVAPYSAYRFQLASSAAGTLRVEEERMSGGGCSSLFLANDEAFLRSSAGGAAEERSGGEAPPPWGGHSLQQQSFVDERELFLGSSRSQAALASGDAVFASPPTLQQQSSTLHHPASSILLLCGLNKHVIYSVGTQLVTSPNSLHVHISSPTRCVSPP